MKIVIEVPEDMYNNGQLDKFFGCSSKKLDEVICTGTPLPKGHGRLVDMSEVIVKLMQYYDREKTIGQCLDEVPTVIEAD